MLVVMTVVGVVMMAVAVGMTMRVLGETMLDPKGRNVVRIEIHVDEWVLMGGGIVTVEERAIDLWHAPRGFQGPVDYRGPIRRLFAHKGQSTAQQTRI